MVTISNEAFNILKEFVKQSGEHLSGCLTWQEWDGIHDLHKEAVYAIKEGLEIGKKKNKSKYSLPNFGDPVKELNELVGGVFFNTTKELETFTDEQQCKKQNERVLKIFRQFRKPCSPSEIHKLYESLYTKTPITSIRRAISTLEKAGHLHKTGGKRKGPHNRNEYLWKA